ncbi:MAG TPA: carboxyl transferase domain-containing protein, partial [Acidimicrobiales bacterium]|nr:carboxyl transferase domain-containing protein [Acidimicrobiales bacterium]
MPLSTAADSTVLLLRAGVPGATQAGLIRLPGTDRKVVMVSVDESVRRGALAAADSETVAGAAGMARSQRLPLVVALASSGADILEGVASLDGWGRAARALADCSGIVPVVVLAYGLAVSGPA